MVRKYSIIIEKQHHAKVIDLMHECWNYKAGKNTLIVLYRRGGSINDADVQHVIKRNGTYIEKYKNFLTEISEDFRAQLRLNTSTT